MPCDRRQPTSAEEQMYASRLALVTRRLDTLIHLIHPDDGYSTAIDRLLDDAIHLHKNAEMRKRDDVDAVLRLLDQAIRVLGAAEEQTKVEREAREPSRLREYTIMLLVVSEWSERFGAYVHTRAGRAYVELARAWIAIATRQEGDMGQACSILVVRRDLFPEHAHLTHGVKDIPGKVLTKVRDVIRDV